MNGCEKYQELISRLIDGELTDAEKSGLEAHISGCTECAALYRAFSSVSSAISADLEDPPEDLKDNVMAAVTGRSGKVTHINHWKSWLAAAACLAIIVFGVSRTDLVDKLGTNVKGSLPAENAVTADAGAEGSDCYNSALESAKGRSAGDVAVSTADGIFSISDADAQNRICDLLSPAPASAAALEDTKTQKSAADSADGEYTFTYPDGRVVSAAVCGDKVLCREDGGSEYVASCTPQELLQFIAELK